MTLAAMIRLTPALLAAVALCLGVLGVMYLKGEVASLEAENARVRADLKTCSARIKNIAEDMESDATVTDPSLFDVPAHWLRPEGSETGN